MDERDTYCPVDVVYRAAELGLTSFMLPEEVGGGGITDVFTGCIVQEELNWGCAGIGNLITSGAFFARPLIEVGTAEQQARWLTPLAGERPPLTALASTEPGVGSDAAAMATSAERTAAGYRLNGQKTWISNGGLAEYYVIFATVAPGTGSQRRHGVRGREGRPRRLVRRADAEDGPAGDPQHRGVPARLRDPRDRRLGEEGKGFYSLMHTFDESRIHLAASAVGIARAALEYALEYAKPASRSASRSACTRRSASGSPTWPCGSTPRAC